MPNSKRPHEKLRRVKIEGFRSIQKAEVELGDVTILIGANGAGKSNFIGFLQMLSYMMSTNLTLFVNERRGANSILHHGSDRTARLTGELEFRRPSQTSLYRFALVPAAGDRLLFTHEDVSYVNDGVGKPFERTLPVGGFESAVPQAAVESKIEIERRVCRIFLDRLSSVKVFHFHNTTANAPIRSFQNMQEDRFLLAQGGNLAVVLYLLKNRYARHYARIVEEMQAVLPTFRDFVLEPSELRGREQIELRWLSKESTLTLGPEQFSDGSIRAAALITLLLQPEELKPDILVIDEPELGLHPYAVGQIARLIAEAGVHRQVIVSTQSSRLLSQFEPEQVVVVESEGGASTFHPLVKEDLQGWLDEFDGDLGRLFEMNVTGGAPQ